MINFCPNCGATVHAGNRFCTSCGTPLESQEEKVLPIPNDSLYVPDRGFMEMFLRFRGRLNPKRFFVRAICIQSVFFLITIIVLGFPKLQDEIRTFILMICSIIMYIFMIPLCVRRCHDLGRPGWYFLIIPIPFLAGLLEASMERWGWHDRWGFYHERSRFTETSILMFALFSIILSVVGIFYFTFASGTDGENEYGPNPLGPYAETPPSSNPVLSFISHVEEKIPSLAIAAVVLIVPFAYDFLASSVNRMNAPTTATSEIAANSVQQSTVPKNATSVNMISQNPPKTPSIPKPPTPPKPIPPAPNPPEHGSVKVLQDFHANITKRNYQKAYQCLSKSFQDSMSYDGWAAGFRTTIASEVSNIKMMSSSDTTAVLTYTLKAVDNIDGKQKIAYYDGTANAIYENGKWKIDDILNKASNS